MKNKQNGKVVSAPTWLAKRMETLRQMQPPTLKEVATHLKASDAIRKRLFSMQSTYPEVCKD